MSRKGNFIELWWRGNNDGTGGVRILGKQQLYKRCEISTEKRQSDDFNASF